MKPYSTAKLFGYAKLKFYCASRLSLPQCHTVTSPVRLLHWILAPAEIRLFSKSGFLSKSSKNLALAEFFSEPEFLADLENCM